MMILDSKKVRKLLRDKGFTQKEVADGIGVNPSTISDWIKGNAVPSNLNLQSLAQLLEISPDELITEQTNNASSVNILSFHFPNATFNIGSPPNMLNMNDADEDDLDNSKSITIDSKILEEINKQNPGNTKEFIEEIIKKHLKLK